MNKEVLISMVNSGKIRFIPLRKCFLCRYLINNYPDFVQIGNWYISKKQVMSWAPKGQAVDGSGWVISFYLSFGLENSTQIKFDKEEEYQRALDCLNEKFNVIL